MPPKGFAITFASVQVSSGRIDGSRGCNAFAGEAFLAPGGTPGPVVGCQRSHPGGGALTGSTGGAALAFRPGMAFGGTSPDEPAVEPCSLVQSG